MLKRRLYLQIYLAIIASLVLVVVLTGILWNVFGRDHLNREIFEVTSRLAQKSLPSVSAPKSDQQHALKSLSVELGFDLSLYDYQRNLITATDRPIRPPSDRWQQGGWQRIGRGFGWVLKLPDRRWLVVDLQRRGARHPIINLLLFLGSTAFGVGLVAYPFVRRLTRRLERLQKGVERIGAGELSVRVQVEGKDEVASLADSFNLAAEKIERLVDSHKLLLANASHELRTPLARIRMGIELLQNDGTPERKKALEGDIAELDTLIDEILLMSRLDTEYKADLSDNIDVVALAAEECAKFEDCEVYGDAPIIRGDQRLLRRLIRNLIENAVKHGAPPVEIHIKVEDGNLSVTVSDHGGGISPNDREKVFQPFYRSKEKQNIKGYGLGLPLVRQIAEAHGGNVKIRDTEIQSGCAIEVRLPKKSKSP